jgi:Kef-type K+ transport system membrane component KefB
VEFGIFHLVAAVLLACAVAGAFAGKLRQPVIVAFIAVGIVLGPVLGVIEPEQDEIELLAKLGISLLLFIVGLELDLRLIRRVGPVALATGLGQVAFTSGVGFFLTLVLGFELVHAVYIAVALTFSSTIIIVKLLSDKRETEELHGRVAIGFLIVQDIVVVIVMITLTAFGPENGGDNGVAGELLATFGRGALFLGAIAVLMRWVLPPLLRRISGQREILLLFAIAWAISLAAFGDLLGISEEVGAFLGGVSLASTPYREAIGARLVALRDFLLLFFFIDLGARMDPGQALEQLPAVLLLSGFVLIGNPIIVMVIMSTIMRYPSRTAFLAGVTVAQISEFSLIFAALGLDLGHIDDTTVDVITMVGLITIALSTYLILYAQQIHERLSGVLSVFERGDSRDVTYDEAGPEPDVIVFGLAGLGLAMVRQLRDNGEEVMGVDLDPSRLEQARDLGVSTVYGDARNPDLLEEIPLDTASWVVSTVERYQPNLALLHALKEFDYRGRIAVTAHDRENGRLLLEEGADAILDPYEKAAVEAVRRLEIGRGTD